MPGFHTLNNTDLDALITYLQTADLGPGAAAAAAPSCRSLRDQSWKPARRLSGSFRTEPGGMLDYPQGVSAPDFRLSMNGYGVEIQARKPPYTSLTAYDLNKGTIKWQIGAWRRLSRFAGGRAAWNGRGGNDEEFVAHHQHRTRHRQRGGSQDSLLRCRHRQGTPCD